MKTGADVLLKVRFQLWLVPWLTGNKAEISTKKHWKEYNHVKKKNHKIKTFKKILSIHSK